MRRMRGEHERVTLEDDGLLTNELVAHFSKKSLLDHARAIFARWQLFCITAVSVFAALDAVLEAPSFFLEAQLRGGRFFLGVVIASILCACFWTVRAYLNDCPVGLEKESAKARRIAQLQRARWEYRLADRLLKDVLLDLDDELAALSQGRVYVPIERQPDLQEYMDWVRLDPPNISRMIGVGQKLLVLDLPAALGSTLVAEKPQAIRNVVYRIRDLYSASVHFERSRRAVLPPEGMERLHELQLDWSGTLRDAVRQMFAFFDRILSLESLEHGQVAFTVTMDEPANVSEFSLELARLESVLF